LAGSFGDHKHGKLLTGPFSALQSAPSTQLGPFAATVPQLHSRTEKTAIHCSKPCMHGEARTKPAPCQEAAIRHCDHW
jgi:hypothetical protein